MRQFAARAALFSLAAGFALIGSSLAQSSIPDILKQTQTNLEKSPWQATVIGEFKMGSSTQEAEIGLQVIPGADAIMRLEFKKPEPMADNFTVLTKKEVWTYLFVSNQIVIEARAKAKLNELVQQIAGLGDMNSLEDQFNLKLEGEASTQGGAAWKLSGTPKKPGQRYASVEVLILKTDPRPLTMTLKDSDGKPMGTLEIRDFKRAALIAVNLKKYPRDATVVRK